MSRRRFSATAGSAVVLLSLVACSQGEGQCAAPILTLSEASVSIGEQVTVSVSNAFSECTDQGGGTPVPDGPLSVVLTVGGRGYTLGVIDVGNGGRGTLVATVPTDVPTGAATMTVPDLGVMPIDLTIS